jgi:CubicO group peptidase (beta-lactamase class C family)
VVNGSDSDSDERSRRAAASALSLLRRQHERGLVPGGQITVRRRGQVLFEGAVGIARGLRATEATEATQGSADEGATSESVSASTTFQVMSVSKAVVAFAIALLEDRGLVEVAAPVARVIPAFAAQGKGDITLLDVLTHRSGLVLDGLVRRPELWSDWPTVVAAISDARPEHPRGTLAYESHAFGWILAEVVRRVTGRSLPEFLAENLPAELAGLRFVRAPDAPAPARTYWLGKPRYRLGGVNLPDRFEEVNNTIAGHRAMVPGAAMIANGRSLVAFYDLLVSGGVDAGGRRVIRTEVLRPYITRQTAGRDRITGAYLVLGRGFALGWRWPHIYGWWGSTSCFGHAGGFCCVAFADPGTGTAVAILTNGNRSLPDMIRRFAPLSQRLRKVGSMIGPMAGSVIGPSAAASAGGP